MANEAKETPAANPKGANPNELSDDQLDQVAGGFGITGGIVSAVNTFKNQMPKTIETIAKQIQK